MTNPVLLMLLQKRRIASLEAALSEIREHIPSCNCHEAYTGRGLVAPDCLYHSSGFEEVEEIINRVLLPKEEK